MPLTHLHVACAAGSRARPRAVVSARPIEHPCVDPRRTCSRLVTRRWRRSRRIGGTAEPAEGFGWHRRRCHRARQREAQPRDGSALGALPRFRVRAQERTRAVSWIHDSMQFREMFCVSSIDWPAWARPSRSSQRHGRASGPIPACAKLPLLNSVARRGLPNLIEATVIPATRNTPRVPRGELLTQEA